MLPVHKDIEVIRGSTFATGLKIYVDEAPSEVYFIGYKKSGDYIFSKTIGADVAVNFSLGASYIECKIRIAPEDTRDISPGEYAYEVKLGFLGEIRTVLQGVLSILPVGKTNISLVRGDTMRFDFKLTSDTAPESIYFSAASNSSDDYIFRKSIGDGIALLSTEGSVRTYRITVSPSDTRSELLMDYLYGLQVALNGDIFTFLSGILTLLPEQIPT